MRRNLQTRSSEETEFVGAELADELAPGDVVLIEGDLGAGKTTLVRGACRALGVQTVVTSPTFTIGQRYAGAINVAHLDLFRIDDLDDEDPQLLDDYVGADLISFVELPADAGDRRAQIEHAIQGVARIARRVIIEHAGADHRTLTIE